MELFVSSLVRYGRCGSSKSLSPLRFAEAMIEVINWHVSMDHRQETAVHE